jgi:alpha-amylase/alpha-mannosidase (GH57 family)
MWHIFVYIFLFHYFETISSSVIHIPVIHNATLQMLDYNATIINGTCHECLCAMVLNTTSISAFNCFQNNNTCELFSKSLMTNSFSLINNSASSVYFISLPINNTVVAVTSIVQNTSKSLLA